MSKKSYLMYVFTVLISFSILGIFLLPKAFSGDLYVSPIMITIGSLEIRWYGFLIALSILIVTLIAEKRAKKEDVSQDDFYSAVIFGIILGVIGARLYYVAFNLDYFSNNPLEIIMINHGGMAIHGGILGAILSIYIYTKFRKKSSLNFLQALDILTFVLPLAQSIGRWGNFFNHEAYGSPTDLPWKMFVAFQHRMPGYENYEFFHPTFLYESLGNSLIFLFLLYYINFKRKIKGEITALYLMLYSILRGFVEILRTDSLYFLGLKTNVLISVILFFVGLFMMIYLKRRNNE
ncbi:MAG: prolipoprotein diacylglyceryl transferase [Thermotogota bacterium]